MNFARLANMSELLLARIEETPNLPAYRQFNDATGAWVDMTWGEFGREVGRWQAALAAEGFQAGDRVAVCMRNRVEWALFDQAALGLSLVTVPLYFDDRADNMAFCLDDAGARLLLLENGDMWAGLAGHVKFVERVLCLTRAPAGQGRKVIDLASWLPPPGDAPRRSAAKANDLMTICYTSGTTGRPKGVMLSHRNILSNVEAALACIVVTPADRFLSFLPLSHMFERTTGYYVGIAAGAHTVYARGITVLADDIRLQRPTVLISVPRIFERIYGKMQDAMPPGSPKRRLFEQAVAVGWRRFRGEAGLGDHLAWPLLNLLVARKLRARLGGRLRLVISGGAPLAPHLARTFVGLGLTILQGYGLTETAPVLCANRVDDNDPYSIGKALTGVELKRADNGELLARGPNIMLGYWHNEEATRAVIDQDGWFHTGDIVEIRDDRIFITGRVKDIIVLSNGEKVPPADAEQAIMRDTAFEQAMLVGEKRPKLGLLVVSAITDLAQLCARANAQLRDFPGYARIYHIARLPEACTVENGLLTPTLKLKRNKIEQRYAAEIEAMYARTDLCNPRA